MRFLALFAALVLAFVFALSGVAKLADPTNAVVFVSSGLGIHPGAGRWAVRCIAVAEVIAALYIAYQLNRSIWPGVLALSILLFFLGMLFSVARLHPQNSLRCGCFGSLQLPWGDKSIRAHLLFDASLAAVSLVQVLAQRISQGPKFNRAMP